MNLLKNFLFLSVTMGLISACGGSALYKDILNIGDDDEQQSSFNSSEVKNIDSETSKEKACYYPKEYGDFKESYDGEIAVQEDEVTLSRHSQRVIRYGCDKDYQPTRDVIVSDSWEEVKKPRTTYYILPKNLKAPQPKGIDYLKSLVSAPWDKDITGKAFNKTSCSVDSPGEGLLDNILTLGLASLLKEDPGIEGPYIPIQIDQGRHYFNMRVHEGMNQIEYHFYDKCEDSEEACKEGTKLIEKGVLNLNVIYDLKEKGEIEEILHIDNEQCDDQRRRDEEVAKKLSEVQNKTD